jgi:rare lipoprotein A
MASISRIASGLHRVRTAGLILSLGAFVAACAGMRPEPLAGVRAPQRATYAATPPAASGRYKLGPPYQQFGVWYVPAEQPDYNAVGLASWYGDGFDGRRTADGETFDLRAISAAHATLPMPCLVEVTNLENGRRLIVRLNDRGPYHPGRIIDLSRAGAEALGYATKGTARVRVRYVGPAPLDTRLTPQQRPLTYAAEAPLPPAAGSAPGPAYVVQAGVFATRVAAERAAGRLASAGVPAIRPMNRRGRTLYRVVVGPWEDRGAAADARERIAALGFGDAWLSSGS